MIQKFNLSIQQSTLFVLQFVLPIFHIEALSDFLVVYRVCYYSFDASVDNCAIIY